MSRSPGLFTAKMTRTGEEVYRLPDANVVDSGDNETLAYYHWQFGKETAAKL